jgi:hypothetical protein
MRWAPVLAAGWRAALEAGDRRPCGVVYIDRDWTGPGTSEGWAGVGSRDRALEVAARAGGLVPEHAELVKRGGPASVMPVVVIGQEMRAAALLVVGDLEVS